MHSGPELLENEQKYFPHEYQHIAHQTRGFWGRGTHFWTLNWTCMAVPYRTMLYCPVKYSFYTDWTGQVSRMFYVLIKFLLVKPPVSIIELPLCWCTALCCTLGYSFLHDWLDVSILRCYMSFYRFFGPRNSFLGSKLNLCYCTVLYSTVLYYKTEFYALLVKLYK